MKAQEMLKNLGLKEIKEAQAQNVAKGVLIVRNEQPSQMVNVNETGMNKLDLLSL